ncbi:unnamed protein product [Rotaria sordida]|uniref:Uncharacterized protein n=1 Tax=Rotaria sordida TaxID=392033 RepID=A0A818J6Y4_9BILA|nr:unnamed protein product [Rotaria sordida]CAF0938984.1 unnamed protein product [Rotaria sordida]CAF0944086.1 unnamed protein product [Rotaria sordida]CAF0971248.1 unnamed protein product [Rotaria sordida]CAF3539272.1 unnamed protein product [Rotaria sordida]
MFLITIPITTILTTVAMLMPYWWSSNTFQIGLWRARTLFSSWITIEPEIDTQEGRLLLILQILSFISVLLTDLSGLIWIIILIRRIYHTSLNLLIFLFFLNILTYFSLSILIHFIWYTTKNTMELIYLSYSFYLTLIIILFHTITLISLTINLAKYRIDHHTIQPYQSNEKISFAFNELIV